MDAEFWDERYSSAELLFGGGPNGVLVTEVESLTPGRALDVGCGEGGDARWLADRGWQVTAIDISQVALDRAAGTDTRVNWVRLDLTRTPPPVGGFDLVSAQYFPLMRRDVGALAGLVGAVAPGGVFLVGGHDFADLPPREELDFDPDDFLQPTDIGALLGDRWEILVDETRARTAPAPAGTHHRSDTVLLARRVS